jgi:hypothetical protein
MDMGRITWADENESETDVFIQMTDERKELLIRLISEEEKDELLEYLIFLKGRQEDILMGYTKAIETINRVTESIK